MADCSGLRDGFGVEHCDDSRLGNYTNEDDSITEKSKKEGHGIEDRVLHKLFDHGPQILGLGRENNSEGKDGKSVDQGYLEGQNVIQRRQRKEIEGMLCRMNEIAKNPKGWSDAIGKELKSTILLVREARLKKYASHQKKKQRIGPSMYPDDPPAHRVEAVRFSSKCSCCSASSSKRKRVAKDSKPTTATAGPKRTPNQVNVGIEFQAEIPPWTGQVSENDSKWAGMRVWPPTNLQYTVDDDMVIGRGRSEVCECTSTGSMTCVRLHTIENNRKLKNELGEAFYLWGLDQKRKSWMRARMN